jgi:hypothetical protein
LSKAGTIAKLEALLSRIRTRTGEPRASAPVTRAVQAAPAPVVSRAAAVAPPPAATPAPPIVAAPVVAARPAVPAAPPAPAPVVRIAPAPAPAPEPPPEVEVEPKTLPPPAVSSELDFAVDVDVSAATPPPAAAAPPGAPAVPPLREPFDSGEQIAAAPSVTSSVPSVEVPSIAADSDNGPSIEQVEALSEDEGAVGDEDEEIVEAPASSRRPVASPDEEHLADLAFGSEDPQAPHHTPPPKSGRLPAQPVVDFDADVTGVRSAVSPEHDVTQPSALEVPPPVLTAQPTRARLGSVPDAPVADVIGEAQRFAPATFMALLDASLSL